MKDQHHELMRQKLDKQMDVKTKVAQMDSARAEEAKLRENYAYQEAKRARKEATEAVSKVNRETTAKEEVRLQLHHSDLLKLTHAFHGRRTHTLTHFSL